jgi:hypothetical protein
MTTHNSKLKLFNISFINLINKVIISKIFISIVVVSNNEKCEFPLALYIIEQVVRNKSNLLLNIQM